MTALPWLAPSLIGLGLFVLAPAAALLWLSGTRWDLVGTAEWVGLSNLAHVTVDGRWWHAVSVSLAIAALTIPLQIAIGMVVGYALSWDLPTSRAGVVRALLLIPWMSAPFTVGVIMRWIFAPGDGALTRLADARVGWLDEPLGALLVVASIVIWQGAGFAALVYAVSFGGVPREIREAATLDGASGLRILTRIWIPAARRTTAFLIVTGVVGSFGLYDVVVPLTAGGPLGATETVSMRIVSTAWGASDFGLAAAMSILALVVELAVLAIIVIPLRRWSR